jgi:hypothetical protein
VVVALMLFASRAVADPAAPPVSTPVPVAPQALSSDTTTISYQGRLANTAGVPITDDLTFTFRLYEVPAGGTPLWIETHWAVPVRDGVFQVLLGSQVPLPTSLFYEHDALYLGVSVGGVGEMAPRQQLSAIPYAQIADSLKPGAVTAGNLTVGGMLTVAGTDIMLRGRGSGGTGKQGRALVDGGPGHGLFVNYENDFGRVQIIGDTTVAGQLRFGMQHRDRTATEYWGDVTILSGWDYIRGDRDKTWVSKHVDFGHTFQEPPVVLISSIGLATGEPAEMDDFWGDVALEQFNAADVSRTGFRATLGRTNDTNFAAEYYYGFVWVAIGR